MGNFLAYYYRDDIDRFDESLDILFSDLSIVKQRPIYYNTNSKRSIYNGQIICRKDYGFDILN